MKIRIRALGPLTGASGERVKGEEFEATKEQAEALIARGYAEAVTEKAAKPAKAEPVKE